MGLSTFVATATRLCTHELVPLVHELVPLIMVYNRRMVVATNVDSPVCSEGAKRLSGMRGMIASRHSRCGSSDRKNPILRLSLFGHAPGRKVWVVT